MRTAFFLLALASHTFAETCPPKENVYPCSCVVKVDGDVLVECKYPALTLEALKGVLSNLADKKNIDLILLDADPQNQEGHIDLIPSNLFKGIDIKKLEIHHFNVEDMSVDGRPGFIGLENTLEELLLLASFKEEYNPVKLKFSHLKHLKELELSMNMITKLSDDWFEGGPASLEYLTISRNDILKVGDGAFASLINLKRLLFQGNRFGSLKRSMFPNPARKLGYLMLDDNGLTNIPEDLFSNMPALNIISLRENGIFKLDQSTWQPVWRQLDVIHLENNPIECDTHMKWIYSLRVTSAIYGTCQLPKDMEGLTLQDFIDRQM